MAVNKIVIDNEVKIDLTADTVSPSTLALGITAHDKSGELITGTMESGIPTSTNITNASHLFLGGRLIDYRTVFTFNGVRNCSYMFSGCSTVEDLSNVTIKDSGSNYYFSLEGMFNNCSSLKKLPNFIGTYVLREYPFTGMFKGCSSLVSIPANLFNYNFYLGDSRGIAYMFYGCESLTTIPNLRIGYNSAYTNGVTEDREGQWVNLYQFAFFECESLTAITNIPVYSIADYQQKQNMFDNTFTNTYNVSSVTFITNNGVPYASNINNATIDLTSTGHWGTLDDGSTRPLSQSVYNHISAVETINTLPDTTGSQYGRNVIKFKKNAGSATSGGAINTLTEEEIAVATAKGWTVALVGLIN